MHTKKDFPMRDAASVSVTDDREAYSEHWYVAFTRTNAERTVSASLQVLGFPTYLPMKSEIRQWSDRKKRIETPVIPRVVFLFGPASRLRETLQIPGVSSLLKAPGKSTPAIVPTEELERFRFLMEHTDEDVQISPLKIIKGEKVTVTRGSLKGMEGLATEDSDGMSRITIRLDNLCCASVSIPVTDISTDR